jgi:hypothetical protein
MTLSPRAWTPPQVPDATPLFHYTSPQGLVGIMTHRELWATEASGLNDLSEFTRGLRYLVRWMREQDDPIAGEVVEIATDTEHWAQRKPSEVFILSASLDGDDAGQWRMYGGKQIGYAIELDTSLPLGVVSGQPESTRPTRGLYFTFGNESTVAPWCYVAYTKKEKATLLRSLLEWAHLAADHREARVSHLRSIKTDDPDRISDELGDVGYEYADSVRSAVGLAAALMKPRGFRGEREVRAVATAEWTERHATFRATDHGVVRHLRLAVGDGSSSVIEDRSDRRLPVRGLTVGPTPYFELGRDTLQALCASAGLDSIKIRSSRIPLRV